AVVALACPAVAIGVPQRAVHRFLCRPVELSLGQEEALGVLQQLLALGSPLCTTFYSRHSLILLSRAQMAPSNSKFHGETNQVQPPRRTAGQQDGFVSLSYILHAPEIEATGRQAPVTLCPARKKAKNYRCRTAMPAARCAHRPDSPRRTCPACAGAAASSYPASGACPSAGG